MAQLIATAQTDSYMNYNSPNTNYGASSTMTLGAHLVGGTKDMLSRVIANFDVSAIPAGAAIASAKLVRTLTVVDASPHSCRILRCKRPTQWTENGVTWNTYDGVNAWASGGADPNDTDQSTPAPVSFVEGVSTGLHEVTGLGVFVRDALDYRGGIVSIVIKAEIEAPPVSQRSVWLAAPFWKLVIEYDAPGVVGGASAESIAGARTARPYRAAGGRRPAPPARAARHTRGATP